MPALDWGGIYQNQNCYTIYYGWGYDIKNYHIGHTSSTNNFKLTEYDQVQQAYINVGTSNRYENEIPGAYEIINHLTLQPASNDCLDGNEMLVIESDIEDIMDTESTALGKKFLFAQYFSTKTTPIGGVQYPTIGFR